MIGQNAGPPKIVTMEPRLRTKTFEKTRVFILVPHRVNTRIPVMVFTGVGSTSKGDWVQDGVRGE